MNKIVSSLLVACIVLACFSSTSDALTQQIEPKSQECYFEFIESGKTSLILYQVIRGGLLDIDFRLFDPRGNTLVSRLHFDTTMKGRQTFTAAESGAYKLCFNNEMSRFTPKVVTFTWTLEDSDKDFVKSDTLNPMEQSIHKIERTLQSISVEQKKLRYREQTNRDTSENTNGRVIWYSIIQVFVLISMGIGQIWYLRRWFDNKTSQRV
ncbi:emp24/gp25L/p24 family protein [Cavenderia fasciculata]|uniref:Emp24/gp25L/p24 family protein n=1 Tax=Cavenderia fasciculata TaxID=261658 RepID=F4QBI3_CACFS|nr:emp24/gp25L/p24 family protein [Cavenderia fasciculata]EGG14955.1 emp24/gp25L/p24 family protein [Cavenderia fasciculata]|eukprot:XP_004351471.1 emp24/gp25L/p24 family protein [Cavenderia fasciculata]